MFLRVSCKSASKWTIVILYFDNFDSLWEKIDLLLHEVSVLKKKGQNKIHVYFCCANM